MIKWLAALTGIILLSFYSDVQAQTRLEEVVSRVETPLRQRIETQGFNWGAPVFMRIFKQSNELEVWLQKADGTFDLFKTYPICTWSGELGPKLRQGDRQAPEGFYFVTPAAMNPQSAYHLSFNLGYPNAYDHAHGRTGDYLMVHGNCVSIGCYAMTDKGIEELYLLAAAAFENGQPFFRTHIFPFRMTVQAVAAHESNQWIDFWRNLKTGYDWFEEKRVPPDVSLRDSVYVFSE